MTYRVAVLLAAYNGLPWIRIQIDSILSQADVDIQLFVGDDSSSDATIETLRHFYANEGRVTLLDDIRIRHGGPAANFIRMFEVVSFETFEYVFLADQDDFWYETKIISAIRVLTSTGSDCYAADLNCLYINGRRRLLRKSYAQTDNDFLFQGASAGCTYGLSRAAADLCKIKFGVVNKEMRISVSHDWLIYAITRSHGLRWELDSNVYIDYRQHESNAYGALGFGSYLKRLSLIRGGWYRKNIIAIGDACALNEAQMRLIAALRSWKIKDRLFLLSQAWTFRRRPLEKVFIILLIFLGFL